MKLYLIRHSNAVDSGTPGYEDDSQRPLTDKGRKKMRQIAKGLRSLGVEVDLVLSSPYVRACETAEILAEVLKTKKDVILTENLTPAGNPEHLLAEIAQNHPVESLALVGHEPNLNLLAGFLASDGAKLNITVKKGGVICLSADDLPARRAMLDWLLTPGILVEIANK